MINKENLQQSLFCFTLAVLIITISIYLLSLCTHCICAKCRGRTLKVSYADPESFVRGGTNLITLFGNDVFSKHLFPMVSYTQNTHKIPIPSNPRSTLLPSPLPRPLQPVLVAGNQMALMQTTLVLLLDKNNIGILLVCCGFQL